MLNNCNRPHIAVAVIIHDKMQNSILMGRRKVYILKFHPYFLILQDCGLYALPGGHLEKFESFQECGIREVKEETGLDLKDCSLKKFDVLNLIRKEKDFHYVLVLLTCERPENQEAQNLEIDKHENWVWVTCEELDQLRAYYFMSFILLLISQKSLFNGLTELTKSGAKDFYSSLDSVRNSTKHFLQ